MKQLQNNFTTPEQSKRLLELGVPEMTSDCFYWEDDKTPSIRGFSENCWQIKGVTPCWSAGRLIELYVKLSSYEYVSLIFKKTFTPMDKILDKFEKDVKNGLLDFSKL